jgi:hypothetical protein
LISCDGRPGFFGKVQEHVRDLWVELDAGQAEDCLACRLERRSAPIGPVGSDGIEGVRYGKDPRTQKNLFSLEPARITRFRNIGSALATSIRLRVGRQFCVAVAAIGIPLVEKFSQKSRRLSSVVGSAVKNAGPRAHPPMRFPYQSCLWRATETNRVSRTKNKCAAPSREDVPTGNNCPGQSFPYPCLITAKLSSQTSLTKAIG